MRRKNKILLSVIVGFLVAILTFGGIVYYIYSQKDEHINSMQRKYEQQIVDLTNQLLLERQEKVDVFVLTKDKSYGESLKKGDWRVVSLPKDSVPVDAVLDEKYLSSKTMKVNMKKNTPITESMIFVLSDLPDDLRKQEFSFIELPSNITKNDFVDIRIKFPTGQDYIVLSKKKVVSLSDKVEYHLNEKEILTMSSAIVDAYLNHAHIYALAYVDPSIQKEAVPTYPMNHNVISLIELDPNIVERASLELEKINREILELTLGKYSESDKYIFSNEENQRMQEEKRKEIMREQQEPSPKEEEEFDWEADMINELGGDGN